MKKKKLSRTALIITGIIALAVIVWCGWYIFQYWQGCRLADEIRENWKPETIDITENLESAEIPVDFEALWEINPEIYAWIYIPGTDISYPILQHDGENSYYLRRSEEGEHFSGGCIFTENYNSKDFSDRMTVIYGHDLHSGKMFAQLNGFSDAKVFDANRYIYIYLPDKVLIYEIFAAYPHSNEHLLLNHDFENEDEFNAYFEDVMYDKNLNACFLENAMPNFKTDKIVTLSTCLDGTDQQRFLVQGSLILEIPGK